MHIIISILGILITIFFVIGTHEFAHFYVARKLGVKVLRFSIGFGKKLWSWKDKSGTEYVIALIPLGGYVQMLDESEGDVAQEELPRAYNRQPFYKKFLIVLAGPVTNILCALILYWLIFLLGFTLIRPIIGEVIPDSIAAKSGLRSNQEIVGLDNHPVYSWPDFVMRLIAHVGNKDQVNITVENKNKTKNVSTLDLRLWKLDGLSPDPFASIGLIPFTPAIPLIIGHLADNSPAISADLRLQDKIIAINKKSISKWQDVMELIRLHPDETFQFTIERNKQIITLPVKIGYKHNILIQKTGYLGIAPKFNMPNELLRHIQYGPISAIPEALQQAYDFTYFNFMLIGKLVTGKVSLQSLGGPITIFDTAGDALNSGLVAFLNFLAFLSISIGVINLLPIPGLDGGHLFIQIIESIMGRAIKEKTLFILYRFGFMLLFCILAIALVNDLLRL